MKTSTLFTRIGCLLTALLLVGMSAGCKAKEDQPGTQSGSAGAYTNDEVVDLDGYTFTIASGYLQDDPDLSTLTGAERSFEEARHQVEEQFNCTIKIVTFRPTIENVRAKILSGDKIADIVDYSVNNLLQSIRSGYVQSLDAIDGIDTGDYRWVSGYTNLAKYDDVVYGLNFMLPAEVRMCLFYNRDLLKQSGVTEDLPQLVRDKQWTFDKWAEIAKQCTRDTNGDGVTDVFGIYTALFQQLGIALINSNGGSLVSLEDGVAKESFNSQNALNALNFLNQLLNTDKSLANRYTGTGSLSATTSEYAKYFVNGECAFLFCESWLCNQYIKPIAGDLDYGILPLPMGPDADDYVSAAYNGRVFAIPSTNQDLDKTVPVFNALAKAVAGEEGDDDDWWDYDIMVDYFQDGDTDSVEMYKLCLEKSYIDLGCGIDVLLADFGEKVVENACYKSQGTPASQIEAITGLYQDAIDSVYN